MGLSNSMGGSLANQPRNAALERRTHLARRAAAVIVLAWGCGKEAEREVPPEPPVVESESPPAPIPNAGVDTDGVVMLYPDAPGNRFVLGDADPNSMDQLSIEGGVRAVLGQEGAIRFWSVDTFDFEYSEGDVPGKTARLHIQKSGSAQQFDWRTQKGFLADPESLGDQEFSAIVRVRNIIDPERAAFELKIRGGQHTDTDPPLASCSMMTFASSEARGVSRFGKELDHPEYDFVNLPPRVATELVAGRWFGLKLISYLDSVRGDRVINQLFVDVDPLLADGSLRNDYRLLAEYIDRAGVSTGRYDTIVSWKGYLTTLRIDGVETLDVARLSARAIEAP